MFWNKINKGGGVLIRHPRVVKSALIPLELTAAWSATDAAIHKKIFGWGITTRIISNKEMNDFMKIVKSLEEFGSLPKGVSEIIKNEAK